MFSSRGGAYHSHMVRSRIGNQRVHVYPATGLDRMKVDKPGPTSIYCDNSGSEQDRPTWSYKYILRQVWCRWNMLVCGGGELAHDSNRLGFCLIH